MKYSIFPQWLSKSDIPSSSVRKVSTELENIIKRYNSNTTKPSSYSDKEDSESDQSDNLDDSDASVTSSEDEESEEDD